MKPITASDITSADIRQREAEDAARWAEITSHVWQPLIDKIQEILASHESRGTLPETKAEIRKRHGF